MTQFTPNSIEKILLEEKTATRRPWKDGDSVYALRVDRSPNEIISITRNGRLLRRLSDTYAICPGRGQPQVARYRLLRLRRQDVRRISIADSVAEGFLNWGGFWDVWTEFYDPSAYTVYGPGAFEILQGFPFTKLSVLKTRPDKLYDARVEDFELCEVFDEALDRWRNGID